MSATNLRKAFVWRAVFPRDAKNLSASGLHWRPETRDGGKISPWTSASFDALWRAIKEFIPAGVLRNQALEAISGLDCEIAEGASCDAKTPEPASVAAARQLIEQASVDDGTYKKAFAGVLGELVCGGDRDAVHILRELLRNGRIKDAGTEAPALVERIVSTDMSKDCPVSALLTDDDQAKLRAVAKAAAPPPPKPPAPLPARKN
jgi:hypothetical protein